jgi:hypothetical protein
MRRGTGIGLLVLGMLLVAAGILFTIVTFGFGIICAWPLVLIGLLFVVLGIVLVVVESVSDVVSPQPSALQQGRFCPGCGRNVGFDAQYCPSCGRKL